MHYFESCAGRHKKEYRFCVSLHNYKVSSSGTILGPDRSIITCQKDIHVLQENWQIFILFYLIFCFTHSWVYTHQCTKHICKNKHVPTVHSSSLASSYCLRWHVCTTEPWSVHHLPAHYSEQAASQSAHTHTHTCTL